MNKRISLSFCLVLLIKLSFAQGTWTGESSSTFSYGMLSTSGNLGGVGTALPNYTAAAASKFSISNASSEGFLPYPPSGFSSVSTNVNDGGFNLANGALTITAATIAANNTNKFTVYNTVGPTSVSSLFFTLNFNTPTATVGAVIYAFGNSASSTTSDNIFNTFNTGASAGMWNSAAATGIFNYLRWDFTTSNGIGFSYRLGSAGGYAASTINSSTFTKTGGAYNIELYCNNSTAAQTYLRGVTTYTLPAQTFNIWVGGVMISATGSLTNFPSSGEAPSGTAINSFGLTANRNTAGPALTATISNISMKYIDASALPVKLTSFTAKKQNNNILLNWNTASEQNNAYFEAQRSSDGTTFKTIGTIKGNGTTNDTHTYSFIDAAPLAGTNYYRINQVDLDGKSTQSTVVAMNEDAPLPKFSAYISPDEELHATVFSETEVNANITISDISGRKITAAVLQLIKGTNNPIVPLIELPKGIYIATLSTGTYLQSIKFFK